MMVLRHSTTSLCVCYAMPGTGIAHGLTSALCSLPTRLSSDDSGTHSLQDLLQLHLLVPCLHEDAAQKIWLRGGEAEAKIRVVPFHSDGAAALRLCFLFQTDDLGAAGWLACPAGVWRNRCGGPECVCVCVRARVCCRGIAATALAIECCLTCTCGAQDAGQSGEGDEEADDDDDGVSVAIGAVREAVLQAGVGGVTEQKLGHVEVEGLGEHVRSVVHIRRDTKCMWELACEPEAGGLAKVEEHAAESVSSTAEPEPLLWGAEGAARLTADEEAAVLMWDAAPLSLSRSLALSRSHCLVDWLCSH
eukprot:2827135-Rhodomonas_salina.2